MNDEREERGLRDLFARQRADESARAPAFSQTAAAVRRRMRRAGVGRALWLLGTASAAAIVAAVVMLPRGAGGGAGQATVDLSAVRWLAATDFLLETPGAELTRTMPRIMRPDQIGLPAAGGGRERGAEP